MGEAKRRKIAGGYPEKTERLARLAAPSADALRWRLDGAPDEHPAAAELLAGLQALKDEGDFIGVRGNLMTVTLERGERDPLVTVDVRGLGAFMNVIELFQSLGLTDRLEGQDGTENGVDAAFG